MSVTVRETAPGKWVVGKDKWEIGRRYKLEKLIGRGAYGTVVCAQDKQVKQTVAIKRIENRALSNTTDLLRILREISILARVKHRHVVSLLCVLPPPPKPRVMQHLYIVLEYAGTDLQKIFRSHTFMTADLVQTIMYQLLLGLGYLHRSGIIHRDLKSANVLLDPHTFWVKIADFGLAKVLQSKTEEDRDDTALARLRKAAKDRGDGAEGEEEGGEVESDSSEAPTAKSQESSAAGGGAKGEGKEGKGPAATLMTSHVVTRWYRAPEVILCRGNYSTSIDVWSLGCIFAEILQMQKKVCSEWRGRRPLFPGRSCFPLSPTSNTCYKDESDQLNVIFSVIGTPNAAAIGHLDAADDVRGYLTRLKPRAPVPLASILPNANPLALDLLKCMLAFDSVDRITIEQAIQHPYLQGTRDYWRRVEGEDVEGGRRERRRGEETETETETEAETEGSESYAEGGGLSRRKRNELEIQNKLLDSNANINSMRMRYYARALPDAKGAIYNLLRDEVDKLRPEGTYISGCMSGTFLGGGADGGVPVDLGEAVDVAQVAGGSIDRAFDRDRQRSERRRERRSESDKGGAVSERMRRVVKVENMGAEAERARNKDEGGTWWRTVLHSLGTAPNLKSGGVRLSHVL